MTSRVGSLLVAGFLGAIALVAVVVIIILTDDGEANDSAVFETSLRDGDIVLIGDPTEIRVTVKDDEPITRISLFVDGELPGSEKLLPGLLAMAQQNMEADRAAQDFLRPF